MKKLTETLIQQRLKSCTTDLDKVQQINVTGRGLQDVSLLRRMTGVEILSFSVNQITSLVDFQDCKNLKELYIRNNKITDINEISYLKDLPKLKLLMLSQNPCCQDPSYRMTVIKNLKNLIELDGIIITPEEKKQAQKVGKDICAPEDTFILAENYIPDGPQIQRTPTQSTQKLKPPDENFFKQMATRPECETIAENETEGISLKEDINQALKLPLLCEKTGKKLPKRFPRNDFKRKHSFYPEGSMCKFCGNESMQSVMVSPKNDNILSATLNLVKELDYSALKIIKAEVNSCLNAFEVDYNYLAKS